MLKFSVCFIEDDGVCEPTPVVSLFPVDTMHSCNVSDTTVAQLKDPDGRLFIRIGKCGMRMCHNENDGTKPCADGRVYCCSPSVTQVIKLHYCPAQSFYHCCE